MIEERREEVMMVIKWRLEEEEEGEGGGERKRGKKDIVECTFVVLSTGYKHSSINVVSKSR